MFQKLHCFQFIIDSRLCQLLPEQANNNNNNKNNNQKRSLLFGQPIIAACCISSFRHNMESDAGSSGNVACTSYAARPEPQFFAYI